MDLLTDAPLTPEMLKDAKFKFAYGIHVGERAAIFGNALKEVGVLALECVGDSTEYRHTLQSQFNSLTHASLPEDTKRARAKIHRTLLKGGFSESLIEFYLGTVRPHEQRSTPVTLVDISAEDPEISLLQKDLETQHALNMSLFSLTPQEEVRNAVETYIAATAASDREREKRVLSQLCALATSSEAQDATIGVAMGARHCLVSKALALMGAEVEVTTDTEAKFSAIDIARHEFRAGQTLSPESTNRIILEETLACAAIARREINSLTTEYQKVLDRQKWREATKSLDYEQVAEAVTLFDQAKQDAKMRNPYATLDAPPIEDARLQILEMARPKFPTEV